MRVNLSFNTQRTTDFHPGLMEFDVAEPNVWQTISFTTHEFDAGSDTAANADNSSRVGIVECASPSNRRPLGDFWRPTRRRIGPNTGAGSQKGPHNAWS